MQSDTPPRHVVTLIGIGFLCVFLLASSIAMVSDYRQIMLMGNASPSLMMNSTLPSFTELLIESGSDKYHRHHYEKYYEKWLSEFRNKPSLKFLEIGARDGKSLTLWSRYFTRPSLILGLAYDNSKRRQTTRGIENVSSTLDNVDVLYGDQSKNETMNALKEKGPWDIIIDDGSHVPQHMMFSLFSLWDNIRPGGLYIIEDLETNYWPDGASIYGYKLQGVGIGASPERSAVSKLQQLQQVLARHQIGAENLSIMQGDKDICSMEWGMNIVAIKKCSDHDVLPPYQEKKYDQDRMEKWLKEAKETNPVEM